MSNIIFNEEAIDFQTDTAIIEELNQVHSKIRDILLKDPNANIEELLKDIEDLVLKRFGLKLILNNTKTGTGPSILPIQLSGRMPKWFRGRQMNMDKLKDSIKEIHKILGKKGYTVDFKNGKIHGLENVVTGILYMPYYTIFSGKQSPDFNPTEIKGFLTGYNFKPEHATAVLLHEIGHAFTFLEYTGKIKKRFLVIYEAFDEYKKTNNDKKLIIKLSNSIGSKEIVDTYNKEKAINKRVIASLTIAVSDYLQKELNDALNWSETSEVVADQFVARFGMSKDIIIALNHIYRSKLNTTLFFINLYFQISNYLLPLYLLFGLLSPIALLNPVFIFFTIFNYVRQDFTYPSNRDRIRRMRTELVLSIKYNKRILSKEEREKILSDIEQLDILIKFAKSNIYTERNVQTNILNILTSKGRATMRSENLYKLLEETTVNDLRLANLRLLNVLE